MSHHMRVMACECQGRYQVICTNCTPRCFRPSQQSTATRRRGGGRTTAIMCNAVHALSTFPLKRRCEDTSLKRCTCVPSAWVNLVGATCLLLHLVHAAFCVCSCGELHLAGFRHALNFTAALLGLLEAGYFLGRISGLILDVAQYRVFAFS